MSLEKNMWTAICEVLTEDVDSDKFRDAMITFFSNIKTVSTKYFIDEKNEKEKLITSVIRGCYERVQQFGLSERCDEKNSLTDTTNAEILKLFKHTLIQWPVDEHCSNLLFEFVSFVITSLPTFHVIGAFNDFDTIPMGWFKFIEYHQTNFQVLEKLFVYCIDSCRGNESLNKLFGNEDIKEDVLIFLIDKMLLNSVQRNHSGLRRSILISKYMTHFNSCYLAFKKICREFCNNSRQMENVDLAQHIQVAIAMVDFCRALPIGFHAQAAQVASTDLLFSLEYFAQSNDTNRKNMGLIVCETMFKMFPEEYSNLNIQFNYDKDDTFVKELLKILDESHDGNYPTVLMSMISNIEMNLETTKENIVVSPAKQLRTIDFDKTLNALRCKDTSIYFSALVELIVALENDTLSESDITEDIIMSIISMPINVEISNCKVFQHRLLELLMYIRPSLVSFALSTVISTSYTMDQRVAVFRGLIGAANLLSTGRGFDHLNSFCNECDSDSDDDSVSLQTADRNQRAESLIRINPSFLKPPRPQHENKYLDQAHLFIFPLVTQKYEFLENHQNNPSKLNIISQIEFTAALMLIISYGSPMYVSLCRAVADFAASIRTIEDAFVQESIIFAYSAMVRGLPPLTLVEHFYDDLSDWIDHVNSFVTVTNRDKFTPLATALSVTIPILQDALLNCVTQLD